MTLRTDWAPRSPTTPIPIRKERERKRNVQFAINNVQLKKLF